MATSKVYIFDTTLRDGEQSPGCSMTVPREAPHGAQAGGAGRGHPGGGLPDRLRGRFRGGARGEPRVPLGAGGGARALHSAGHRARGAGAGERQAPAAHPHLHRHQRHPPQVQAEEDARSRCSTRRSRPSSWRASTSTTSSSPPRTARRTEPDYLDRRSRARSSPPAPARSTSPTRSATRMPEEYGALIGRVVKALGRLRGRQRPLPRRPRPGGRELAGGGAGRRAPDRVHHQRHRRARGQLLARRDRDGR